MVTWVGLNRGEEVEGGGEVYFIELLPSMIKSNERNVTEPNGITKKTE